MKYQTDALLSRTVVARWFPVTPSPLDLMRDRTNESRAKISICVIYFFM